MPPQGNPLQLNTLLLDLWTHSFRDHSVADHFHLVLIQSVRANIVRRVWRLNHLPKNEVATVEGFFVLLYCKIWLVEIKQSILQKINLFYQIIWFSCIKVAEIFPNFFSRYLSRPKTIFKCGSNYFSADIFVIFSCSSSHWNKVCLLKARRNFTNKTIKFWWANAQFFEQKTGKKKQETKDSDKTK